MNKLYVLVRRDLSHSYRFVQGAHAVAEWCLKYPDQWQNETIVFVEVNNQYQLLNWVDILTANKVQFQTFKEPDLNNQITAIAALNNDQLFKKLHLA